MNCAYVVDDSPEQEFYEVDYEAAALPTASSPAWTLTGVSHASVASSILTIITAGTDLNQYSLDLPHHSASTEISLTVKIETATGSVTAEGYLESVTLGDECSFKITGDSEITFTGSAATAYAYAFTSDVVTVKMVLHGNGYYSAWVDNILVVNALACAVEATYDRVRFGKCSATSDNSAQYWSQVLLRMADYYRDGFNKIASTACTITSSQQETEFPLTNLHNKSASNPARFSVKSDVKVDFDFGSAQTCNVIGLFGHNLTKNAVIWLLSDDNSAFSSPNYHQLEWAEGQIIMLLRTGDGASRYWRLHIQDPLNEAYPFIGEMILGNYVEFTQNFDWDIKWSDKYNTVVHETDFGNKWIYYLNKQKSVAGMDFAMITDDSVDEVLEFYDRTEGGSNPLMLLWNPEDHLERTIYGYLTTKFGQSLKFVDVNNIDAIAVTAQPFAVEVSD